MYLHLFEQREAYTNDEQSKLYKVKNDLGHKDSKMNQFKLMIYKWDLNETTIYYDNDLFCNKYCIAKNYNYGCPNKSKNEQCPFGQHSINLRDLIWKEKNYKMAQLLCLYLMYKNQSNDKNAQLYHCYGEILLRTANTRVDYLKSEKYFLQALSIDNNIASVHNNYALMLQGNLKQYDKAEYHHKQALEINSNNATRNCNFASFLIEAQKEYKEALFYCDKACQLNPNHSTAHYIRSKALKNLNIFDEAIQDSLRALKLNKNDHRMNEMRVNDAKYTLESCVNNLVETRFGKDIFDFVEIKLKDDSKNDENDSKTTESIKQENDVLKNDKLEKVKFVMHKIDLYNMCLYQKVSVSNKCLTDAFRMVVFYPEVSVVHKRFRDVQLYIIT